jgi:hypothetical protein
MEAENVNFDNEVLAFLSKRKSELIEEHGKYINEKPEIREVLNDFLSSVLLSKPVRNQDDNHFSRMMYMCMQKNTSTRLTQLH